MLRGINRDVVFLEEEDRQRFLQCLLRAKTASSCLVLAYCLMDNHVHLVLRTTDEPIGSVVKRLGVRYAGWFNRKYGRVGHLFQDRFKSHAVEDDAYLVTLLRYVWNNPVAAGVVASPGAYRWSSYQLLGRNSLLVDEDELRKLLPDDPTTWLEPIAATQLDEPLGRQGRPPTHSLEQAAELLFQTSGAASPAEFRSLDHTTRRRAIRDLRMRSVSYAQIAAVTGLSPAMVRRIHIARAGAGAEVA